MLLLITHQILTSIAHHKLQILQIFRALFVELIDIVVCTIVSILEAFYLESFFPSHRSSYAQFAGIFADNATHFDWRGGGALWGRLSIVGKEASQEAGSAYRLLSGDGDCSGL